MKFIVQDTPKGKGVFTSAPIHANEFLFSFRESGTLLNYQATKDPSLEAHCLQIGHDQYIWVTQLPQRYVNHSCEPNTGLRDGTEFYALREIEAGEEITFDYSTTMDEDDWEMDCLCGASTCRGHIRDFKYLPIDLQLKYIQWGIVAPFCLERVLSICLNCNGACCCENCVGEGLIATPFLTPEDVERIQIATGMNESEFAVETGLTDAPDTPLMGHIKQMRTKPSGHGCMFFNEETRRCNIYPSRPLDCRLFPLDIVQENGKAYLILHTELCSINQAALDLYVQHAQTSIIPLLKPYLREYTTIRMDLLTHSKWKKIAEIDMKDATGNLMYFGAILADLGICPAPARRA